MKQKRMKPEARKEDILTAALSLAGTAHYMTLTREQIAEAAGISGATVQYHFKTMGQLRTQLMRAAVKRECLKVVAQGLLADDPHAKRAAQDLRDRARGAVR